MLLIDELETKSYILYCDNECKGWFLCEWSFSGQPVMPGVLIVEAFGQAAAALTAHGIDKKTYENKLVFLMSVEKHDLEIQLYQIVS